MALSKQGAKPVKIALANAKNLPIHVDVRALLGFGADLLL